jgi:hypothetical protein
MGADPARGDVCTGWKTGSAQLGHDALCIMSSGEAAMDFMLNVYDDY